MNPDPQQLSQGMSLLTWSVFLACLGLSFLLSGMEAGVFALSRLRIRQQMRAGRRSAAVLLGYLENPENFLWTILVGNTVANLVITGWIFLLLYQWLANWPVVLLLSYSLVVLLLFTLLDLLPKTLFRLYPNRLCMGLSRPFTVVHLLLRPLVMVVESISTRVVRWTGGRTFTGRVFGNREELRLLMQESAPTLTTEEKAMINRVLDFQSLTVRQAMKPLSQVVSISATATVGDALDLCRNKGFTRFPVWGENEGRRRVMGFVSCNALLYPGEPERSRSVAEYLKPALFLNEDVRLELALRRLQRGGQRLAIVLGRDHRESGIITLQDVLRALFGDISI